MYEVKPDVLLLQNTTPEEHLLTIYMGYRRCYSDKHGVPINPTPIPEIKSFIRKMLQTEHPHESPLEHVSLTFNITCSRACSHQLVRHRIASYSQQSQRYVKVDDLPVIVPPSIAANPEAKEGFMLTMQAVEEAYKVMTSICEVAVEDARFILPQSAATQVIVTMNFRSLLHFFRERCCNRAQWEIRDIANQMLDICKSLYPCVFENAGPHCKRIKHCPEAKPCGKQPWKEA